MAVSTWAVVNFLEENSVQAVPTSWIRDNGECYWPPVSGETLANALKSSEPPQETWKIFKCKIFENGTFDNYLYARKKAKKAEMTSDLSSTDTGKKHKRKIIKRKVVSSSSSESFSSDEVETLSRPPSIKKFIKSPKSMKLDMMKNNSPARLLNNNVNNSVNNGTLRCSPAPQNSTPFQLRSEEQVDIAEDAHVTLPILSNSLLRDLSFNITSRNATPTLLNANDSDIPEDSTSNKKCRCCHHQDKMINCLGDIIKKLRSQKSTLQQILEDVNMLKNQVGNTTGNIRNLAIEADDAISKTVDLPLMTVEAVDQLEAYLELDGKLKNAQMEFSAIGGNNANDFIKRALPKLMDDGVLKQYNWEGKKGKRKLKSLRSMQLILGALEMSQGLRDEKVGAQLIKNFVKNASERIKQRNTRK